MFIHKRHEQVQKAIRGFFFQDYRLGEKAVTGTVAGGILLSVFRDGATGARSVGS